MIVRVAKNKKLWEKMVEAYKTKQLRTKITPILPPPPSCTTPWDKAVWKFEQIFGERN